VSAIHNNKVKIEQKENEQTQLLSEYPKALTAVEIPGLGKLLAQRGEDLWEQPIFIHHCS